MVWKALKKLTYFVNISMGDVH